MNGLRLKRPRLVHAGAPRARSNGLATLQRAGALCSTHKLEVYAVSDIHADYAPNRAWLRSLSRTRYKDAALIVAGDVSDRLPTLREALLELLARWRLVFFVPGNHELWVHAAAAAPAAGASGSADSSSARGSGSSDDGGAGGASQAADSIAKLQQVLELCIDLGVHVTPQALAGGRLVVAPLLAWHHASWDREPDIPGVPQLTGMGALMIADYAKCCWPPEWPACQQHGAAQVAVLMDTLNDLLLQPKGGAPAAPTASAAAGQAEVLGSGAAGAPDSGAAPGPTPSPLRPSSPAPTHQQGPQPPPPPPLPRGSPGAAGAAATMGPGPDILTFSHFVPHQRLLPEKRFLTFPPLAKAVGSDPLAARVAALQPTMHIFGHSHFAWDATLDGVRYLQTPLCYPREREQRGRSIRVAQDPWQQQRERQQQADGRAAGGATTTTTTTAAAAAAAAVASATTVDSSSSSRGNEVPASGGKDVNEVVSWLPLKVYEATWHTAEGEAAAAADAVVSLDGTGGSREELKQRVRDAIMRLRGLGQQQGAASAADSTPAPPPLPAAAAAAAAARGAHSPPLAQQQQQQEEEGMGQATWQCRWVPPLHGAMWSDYYSANERTPWNLELAPWVAPRYQRRAARAAATSASKVTVSQPQASSPPPAQPLPAASLYGHGIGAQEL